MAVQEPSNSEYVDYFKAMASGKLQKEDLGAIGKPLGGRNSRVLHYRMTYPNGPVKPPIQKVTSEVEQSVEQAKAELGLIKKKKSKQRSKSSPGQQSDNIFEQLKKTKKKGKKKSSKRKKSSSKK